MDCLDLSKCDTNVVRPWHDRIRPWEPEHSEARNGDGEDEERGIGLIGGIEKRDIQIVSYDSHWPEQYQTHATLAGAALGHAALRIEHIGSTSVPTLAAKPIIDILIVVRDSSDEVAYLPKLEEAGYQLRAREPDFHEHRMFRTPDQGVHIHVLSNGSTEVERMLIFRERLWRNPGGPLALRGDEA